MKSKLTQVGKQQLELTNLDKVLFPELQILKAEVIEYYLNIAPTILRHIRNRPLTLVRFPEGVQEKSFFQKNIPATAPKWVEHCLISKTDQVICNDAATLVWLASQACLEIHQLPVRRPDLELSDYMVFDLDPPVGTPFAAVVELALALKILVENHGYHLFAKSTGSKGLHLVAPLERSFGSDRVFAAAQDLARRFVAENGSTTTLRITKAARVEKVLVDIYRNRPGQTIVAPYSLRANESAAVSYPLPWSGLDEIEDQLALNIQKVPDLLRRDGDAWEGIEAYATGLHTERPTQVAGKKKVRSAGKSKTTKQLIEYEGKRRFAKTPEPAGKASKTWKNDFVVHRHHARNVHCDLRLERDGVLWSFAVPRGLPPRPGIKRLAVKVEDHPLEYADFEGRIPKGEYGAGPMWILARGKYEVTKDKKDSTYIRVASKGLDAEFRLINTRGKDWLLERIDEPQIDWTRDPLEPMMAESVAHPPSDANYLFEVKWDGLRALVSLDDGELTIRSRNQKNMTEHFQELVDEADALKASTAVFDGEIVCLDEAGRPQFETVLSRLHSGRKVNINKAFCYLFDCLYLDGVCLTGEPLERRRELLADAVPVDSRFRLSLAEEEGDELFAAAGSLGLEGIMAKGRDSTYRPGIRSSDWLKIKVSQSVDCLVVGFTAGKGDRAGGIGALHLAEKSGRALRYIGKVGSGFSDATLVQAADLFKGLIAVKKPIRATVADERVTTWLEPKLICEVEYSARTSKGLLRNARLKRLRPDLSDLQE